MTSSFSHAPGKRGFGAWNTLVASAILLCGCGVRANNAPKPVTAAPASATSMTITVPAKRFLMAHYMPWYASKQVSGSWGWHWTMNHFDPERVSANGQRDGASHYHPLIGFYDSNDPDALQCQVLLMKLAGIDGVIVDWYGNDDYFDYGINNRNTQRLIPFLQQAGLHFALCYEDQTVPNEIKGKVFAETDAVPHAQRMMQWVEKNFFSSPAYLKFGNRPVFLTFGTPYYNDAQWNQIFSVLQTRPLYFTEHDLLAKTAAVGGFDWPIPNSGLSGALKEQDGFYDRAKSWPLFIASAYPRFNDIYVQAGIGKSWGSIDDQSGQTYKDTLNKALLSKATIVQLTTWNDWGEGTQIEPSVEFGYRDLEVTQQLRKQHLEPAFSSNAKDLRLPVEWYLLRKKYVGNSVVSAKLATFFPLVVAGRMKEARALLAQYKK